MYDWVVTELGYKTSPEGTPKQIEFAKLYLTNVVTGKRYIKRLVEEKIVDGWDDPRLVSIAALRRRGYTPESIQKFIELGGISKANSSTDYAMLEYCIREDLKMKRPRMMAVLDPVKVVIDNYPQGQTEELPVDNNLENPEQETMGTRQVPFGRTIYIEREDFMETPVKKFFRMTLGKEVRLKGAYIVHCDELIKDEKGKLKEIHCTVDFDTRSGTPGADRKVKGTLHWVYADTAVDVAVRLYDYLISPDDVDDGRDFMEKVNTDSLVVMNGKAEPVIKEYDVGSRFQFLRKGYFIIDKDSTKKQIVCNRIVGLRDTWAKLQKIMGKGNG